MVSASLLCDEAKDTVSEKTNQRIGADGAKACRLLPGNWVMPSW